MNLNRGRRFVTKFLAERGVPTILVDTITEKTADGGVSVESVAIEDGAATFSGAVTRTGQILQIANGAKLGTTAGGAVNAADNLNSLARVPASQTAATIVIPITGLKIGDIITGYTLHGQIESGGNIATVDAALHKQTVVAAGFTTAAIASGGITQISKTADAAIDATNGQVLNLAETMTAGVSYFLLVTVTTNASTDVDLLSLDVIYTEK
jgi:hypothetical protein